MKLISWNVNGIRAIVKKEFQKDLEALEWDVLCLQETKAQVDQTIEALPFFHSYEIIANHAVKKGYSGTTIISKQQPEGVLHDMGIEEHDLEGRVICVDYASFYLINVYVPNSGNGLKRLPYRKGWDADFLKYLKAKNKKKPVIVCGDFNVAHQAIDLKNDKANYNKTSGYTQVEIDGMSNFLKAGFVDIFRHRNPELEAYTYWSMRMNARKRNVGWRLDYFLISESLVEKVNDIEILSDIYGSDHCPVLLDIAI
ncbi:MAG: exodeoxyribonuclease III [Flavobacteriaceae bacterium]|nr:exodeoxyribonuclease III [Flavobacteriaceae bacterium]